jgi:universal stress protein A
MPNQNIIIAVDSSDEADQVISAAKEIVRDASLTLITVVQPIAYAYGPEQAGLMTNYGNFEEAAAKACATRLEALATRHEIACDKITTVGQPAQEIRKQAEDSNADLIVIGSHGRHGLGLLLGSTANGVLHGAPCNVFVVRIK